MSLDFTRSSDDKRPMERIAMLITELEELIKEAKTEGKTEISFFDDSLTEPRFLSVLGELIPGLPLKADVEKISHGHRIIVPIRPTGAESKKHKKI